jgi:hypothetical protein
MISKHRFKVGDTVLYHAPNSSMFGNKATKVTIEGLYGIDQYYIKEGDLRILDSRIIERCLSIKEQFENLEL